MRRSPVIGQTGRKVLSDMTGLHGRSSKKTVRYEFRGMGPNSWMASVIGPFDSRMYGACGFGMTKDRAARELRRNLADNHGYTGNMILSVTGDKGFLVDKVLAHCKG